MKGNTAKFGCAECGALCSVPGHLNKVSESGKCPECGFNAEAYRHRYGCSRPELKSNTLPCICGMGGGEHASFCSDVHTASVGFTDPNDRHDTGMWLSSSEQEEPKVGSNTRTDTARRLYTAAQDKAPWSDSFQMQSGVVALIAQALADERERALDDAIEVTKPYCQPGYCSEANCIQDDIRDLKEKRR
jgi:hypothetical protein